MRHVRPTLHLATCGPKMGRHPLWMAVRNALGLDAASTHYLNVLGKPINAKVAYPHGVNGMLS
ncbi:hypothetical protein PSEUDO8Z_170115 [Pseudomonas sp. 8Z]|nr:hypothetical protein PSEUDO8Z_170115 [Pseudomonas sp. 8Z]